VPRERDSTGREVLIEFVVQGAYVRVAAIDAETGTEAVAVGAASASKEELTRLAVRKLEYVLAKKRGEDATKHDKGDLV
jgi:hypothetical protein